MWFVLLKTKCTRLVLRNHTSSTKGGIKAWPYRHTMKDESPHYTMYRMREKKERKKAYNCFVPRGAILTLGQGLYLPCEGRIILYGEEKKLKKKLSISDTLAGVISKSTLDSYHFSSSLPLFPFFCCLHKKRKHFSRLVRLLSFLNWRFSLWSPTGFLCLSGGGSSDILLVPCLFMADDWKC